MEMMNAKVFDDKHICFEGYVLSNETYGDLVQGSIAFEPFTDSDVIIPSVYCQFTGINGATFLDYEIATELKSWGNWSLSTIRISTISCLRNVVCED